MYACYINNEIELWLLTWGVQLIINDVVVEDLPTLPNVPSLTTRPLLMGSSYHFSGGQQPPPLDEEWAYLANLFRPVLEEELVTLP